MCPTFQNSPSIFRPSFFPLLPPLLFLLISSFPPPLSRSAVSLPFFLTIFPCAHQIAEYLSFFVPTSFPPRSPHTWRPFVPFSPLGHIFLSCGYAVAGFAALLPWGAVIFFRFLLTPSPPRPIATFKVWDLCPLSWEGSAGFL